MKKQVGLRIEGHLKDGLDAQAQRAGTPATTLLERYIERGLAHDSGELVEQNSLPAVREAVRETVREEVNKAISHLYQQLSADLQKSARRSDDRLAALLVKAARSAGIGQRMIYALIAKLVVPGGAEFAARAYEDAETKVGRDLARPAEEKG